MASLQQEWEDLNVTKDEVDNIFKALKNEEFRKLLVDYVEETQNPENRKKYQTDIVQLEAERGIDCTFVNPTPGFVVKTSIDGVRKAFLNICSNGLIDKPVSTPVLNCNTRGLSWSIPHSLTPGRDDYDKKNNRCVVYDVVFHPDTLHLAHNNSQFHDLVVDTALKGVEDAFNVTLDKQNLKLPKLKYKGVPNAAVIRKKSGKVPVLTEEEEEIHKKLNMPSPSFQNSKLQQEPKPAVTTKSEKPVPAYATPRYFIKYRNDVDIGEYTDDRLSKINAAIPKELVIEIHLPLLSSTKDVDLDISEKSLQLHSEKPAKYKLNLQLPYPVSEDGNAKFDATKRVLTVILPVIRKPVKIVDFIREDSGVESDMGEPLVQESSKLQEESLERMANDFYPPKEPLKRMENDFLSSDIHYLFPAFDYNRENTAICFILNVKNIDPTSVKRQQLDKTGFHIKFTSVGSGCFPIHYAFCALFQTALTEDILVEVWDNNVTIQVQLSSLDAQDIIKVGVHLDEMEDRRVDEILDLTEKVDALRMGSDADDGINEVTVLEANTEEVVFEVNMEEDSVSSGEAEGSPVDGSDGSGEEEQEPVVKLRTYSEGSNDESPAGVRKSILKKRMNRSLSESCADDGATQFPRGVLYTWSDSCIPEQEQEEDEETKGTKKTVRFSQHIQRQVFRANSSILGQRRKNQKRTRNKKRAQERRASESENSEGEERDKWTKNKGNATDTVIEENPPHSAKVDESQNTAKQPATKLNGGKKNRKPKSIQFQSELITRLTN